MRVYHEQDMLRYHEITTIKWILLDGGIKRRKIMRQLNTLHMHVRKRYPCGEEKLRQALISILNRLKKVKGIT